MLDEDDVETLESLGLTEDEYKAVKKCGDARMQMVLGRAGYDVDDTLNLTRNELMVAYGKYVVNKRVAKEEMLSDKDLKIPGIRMAGAGIEAQARRGGHRREICCSC